MSCWVLGNEFGKAMDIVTLADIVLEKQYLNPQLAVVVLVKQRTYFALRSLFR